MQDMIKTKVETSLGFFSSLGTNDSALKLEQFLSDPNVRSADVGSEFASWIPSDRGSVLMGGKLAQIAQKIADYFRGYTMIPLGQEEVHIPVTVLRIYCPEVTGAKASVELATGGAETAKFKFMLFGTGGSDEYRVSFEISNTYEVEAKSIALTTSIPATIEKRRLTFRSGKQMEVPYLVGVRPEAKRLEATTIQQLTGSGAVEEEYEYVLPAGQGLQITKQLRIGRASTWSDTIGLKLSKIGIDTGLSVEGTQNYETVYSYTLVSGYKYHARRYAGEPHWAWQWSPAGEQLV